MIDLCPMFSQKPLKNLFLIRNQMSMFLFQSSLVICSGYMHSTCMLLRKSQITNSLRGNNLHSYHKWNYFVNSKVSMSYIRIIQRTCITCLAITLEAGITYTLVPTESVGTRSIITTLNMSFKNIRSIECMGNWKLLESQTLSLFKLIN